MKARIKSVKTKLFLTLSITVIVIIAFLILLNNFVLETYYLYSKGKVLKEVYDNINSYYNNNIENVNIETELEKIAFNNNFDIIIKTGENISVYTSNKDFLSSIDKETNELIKDNIFMRKNILYANQHIIIKSAQDRKTGYNFILLTGKLENGYLLYIRVPISPIQESVKISNNFLYLIGCLAIFIGGIVVLIISKKFTKPIEELNQIAKQMARLDFSKKYRLRNTDDEINELGKSMNIVSEKLEKTIKELQKTNIELEKDIEEKSQIDKMRQQFISDVSHELKTPIALIQGYAEGLIENVNSNEEDRKYYTEVILDEANKMDKLVKQLLELMKLEYGKREFNNTKFDIVELIREVIRKSKVMLEENKIEVLFNQKDPILVYADDFYIEQVVTNYFTNAIKHAKPKNGKKEINISIEEKEEKIRINVFNTGDNISEENQNRIWNRFYKIDASRNREDGGTGIGLSLVKAIMNNYGNDYGVVNKENGVEFYFELNYDNKMVNE